LNYFELHIGDYDSATAHLSMVEDAAYGRLLRLCYRTEGAVPVDRKQVYRLVRAVSKPERDAVDQVLTEFFELREDGWHNARCDAEIERFAAGEPEREVKKANEDNRLRRHREERAALFKVVTDAGEHLSWNIPMAELRAAAKRIQDASGVAVPPLPATAPATPATATQAPVPISHLPDTISQKKEKDPPLPPAPQPASSARGRLSLAFKAAGILPEPGHAEFQALADSGAEWPEFEPFVAKGLLTGHPFRYVVAAVVGERRRAAANGPMPPAPPPRANRQQALEDSNRAVGERWAQQQPQEDADHGSR